MLVCPHCQSDNPNHNLFCQNCGESLTFHHCHECNEKVPFGEATCSNCGAMTGTTWWALVTVEEMEKDELSSAGSTFLDIGQRYRLEEPLLPPGEEIPEWRGRVFDCQPLQKSALKVLLEDRGDGSPSVEGAEVSWFPQSAVPYLALRDFYPSVPEVHEAWQEGTRSVILLEDRSRWPSLAEVVERENPPVSQLIYWFDEIARLWKALSELGCCRSVLLASNLRVDEDRAIALQQLVADLPWDLPTLAALAGVWQDLPRVGEGEFSPTLRGFWERLRAGEIDNVTDLRLQLQELAEEGAGFEGEEEREPDEASEDTLEFLGDDRGSARDSGATISTGDITSIDGESDDEHPTAVVPMRLFALADAGHSDNGRSRRHNEDCFGIYTEIYRQQGNRTRKTRAWGIYVVCDGMGGHAAGEVASSLAARTLLDYFTGRGGEKMLAAEVIEQGILLANRTIFQVNQDKDSYGSGRMGTTLVMAIARDTTVAIAHVGDSRIYRVNRKDGLEQLTVDHEVGQRAIQEGVDAKTAYSRPDAYQLTQALGPHDNEYIKPDIRFLEIQEDTLLLLCSDGLSDNELVEKNWQTHLLPLLSSSANLEEGVNELIALANQKNGHDNITAIVVRVKVQPVLESTSL